MQRGIAMSQAVRGVIARSKRRPVELVDIVIPDPGPGEVVVDIMACGVCHTDLTYREGGINDEYTVCVPGSQIPSTHSS
jgi:S-(hydroxymethyl)mycothiol dehydrogenase